MTEPARPEHDDMAEGLRAAFGSHDPDTLHRSSIRRRLQEATHSKLDLHLHDRDEDSDPPVRIDDAAKSLRDPTGRYQVLGEIGRGGVGVVFKGRDQDLGRDVAIKALRPEHVSRPEIVERFVEEAQIGGQLQHPGIVPVYEIGLQAGERPYFAMKLVKGQTLAELLAQRHAADEDRRRFLGIFEQVCQTIAYAHARRVVHRDIKPHNVMLGSFGEVQVVDWGFAKVLPLAKVDDASPPKASAIASVIATVRSDPKKGSHSVVGSMMGTPAYMPPEQALGDVEHMDQRSDVFGLGAMLCEILTGTPPYLAADGDLIHQAARADLQGAYGRLERCGADAVLIALCKQCLSPSRMARPDSAKEVAAAVAQYLTSVEDRAREAQIRAAEAKVRARSTLLLSAAAVLLLALGGGGYLHLQHEKQTRQDQADQRVATALNEANVRLGEARTKSPPDLVLWSRAADATKQADQLAAEPDVAAEQRSHASQLSATVHDEQAKAIAIATQLDRDAAMQHRLLEVRTQRLDDQGEGYMLKEFRRREKAYAAAFATYLDGRDLTTMKRDDAVKSLSSRIAVELASGLDCWCGARRSVGIYEPKSPPDPAVTARLSELASTIDPDPWRVRMRMTLTAADRDRDAIVALALDADLESLPAASMLLLASALGDVGEATTSMAVYERACARFPTDFACFFQLGLARGLAGEFAEAATCFRVAHALRPDMHDDLHQLGKALNGLGEHVEEERIFRQLEELQPTNGHWPFHVGLVQLAEGKLDEAIASQQRALELDPTDGQVYINLGILFSQQGRHDDALAILRRALEVDPNNTNALTNLGNELTRQGKLDEALANFRRALEIDPKNGHFHFNVGKVLAEQNQLDAAVASLRRALEIDPKDTLSLGSLGNVLTQQSHLDEAISTLRRAIELDPNDVGLHYNLAIALGLRRDAKGAIASYRRAIELDPKDARPRMNLGNLLSEVGELDEAAACYRRAATLWAGQLDDDAAEWRPKATRALAGVEARIKHRDRLLAVLRGEVASKDRAELGEAALLGLLRGENQLSIRAYQLALELAPEDAELRANLGVAYERLKKFDDAIACYERAIELAPDVAHYHVTLGNALKQNGDVDEAIGSYHVALDLDPKSVEGWLCLCDGLLRQGENDAAVEAARKAVELAPKDPGPVVELGVALHAAGRVDESIASFRKVIELDPDNAIAHHDLGAALFRSGHVAEAAPCYRRTVELRPDEAQFQLDLALTLQALGEHDAAKECFRKAVELDPKLAIAQFNVGWYAQAKQRWDEAIKRYRKALEIDPDYAEAHCNLAMCLQNAGHFAAALDEFRRGHELGSKRKEWTYPSAEWLRTAEMRAALEKKLPDLVAGKLEPRDNEERVEYANMCQAKGLDHAAVKLYADAFAADPKLVADVGERHRYDAALSAARAGTGHGEDAALLDEPERARWRKQALDWLRADLVQYAKRIASGKAEDRAAVETALREWQEEPDLAGVREIAALASLPPDEREAVRRLWTDVAELLRRKAGDRS